MKNLITLFALCLLPFALAAQSDRQQWKDLERWGKTGSRPLPPGEEIKLMIKEAEQRDRASLGKRPEPVISNIDVLRMKAAGFSDELIIRTIKTRQSLFDTTPNTLIEMKQLGVSEAVISVILDVVNGASRIPQNEFAAEQEESFQNTPARTVIDVLADSSFLVDFDGRQKLIYLHGIQVSAWELPSISASLKKQYRKKKIFVRCVDADCRYAYFYEDKFNPSLNAHFVQSNQAVATPDALFDVASPRRGESSLSTSPGISPTPSTSLTPGRDVRVDGYYRKDGTYVRPHTRSTPSRRR